MPTTNFTFPGVSLDQIFVPRPVGTAATLGTVCIGPKYRIHSYGYTDEAPITGWEAGQGETCLLPGYNAMDGILDTGEEYDKLHVIDGIWTYTDAISGTVDITGGSYGITMNVAAVAGRYIEVGDIVNIQYGTAEVQATVTGVEVGTPGSINVDRLPTGAGSGTSVTVTPGFMASKDIPAKNIAGLSVTSDGYITLPATITADFTDGFISATSCTLKECSSLYYDYRVLDTTASSYGVVENGADIAEQLGPAINANPLAQAVACALAAAGGNSIYWMGTGTADTNSDAAEKYRRCLDYIGDNSNIYNVVPATTNENVILALVGEVERIGKDENSKVRRTLWYGIDTPKEIYVFRDYVATSIVEATADLLEDEPADIAMTDNNEYTATYAEGTLSSVGLNIVTDFVAIESEVYAIASRKGDTLTLALATGQSITTGTASTSIIRTSYTVTYPTSSSPYANPLAGKPLQRGDIMRIETSDYVIVNDNGSNVVNIEKSKASAAAPTGTSVTTSIIRGTPTDTQLLDAIIAECVTKSYRAQCVWADTPFYNGEYVSNYCVAAAAAGMRTAEEPWRPLSNLSYSFFSCKENHNFTKSQLEKLGANGIWIVANNDDRVPINKKSITSIANDDINTTSESIVANADEIAIVLSRVGEELVGSSNISDMLLLVLKDGITNLLDARCTNATSAYVGNQLISYEIVDIYQDPVNLDTVKADIELVPPKPFNRFRITMRIV